MELFPPEMFMCCKNLRLKYELIGNLKDVKLNVIMSSVLGRIMPQSCPCSNPEIWHYVTLHGKGICSDACEAVFEKGRDY